jgi:hypothetical protein
MRKPFAVLALLIIPATLWSQDHTHGAGMSHAMGGEALPTLAGQDAYGAIAEIVGILEADSTTDWSRVNLEALRQHLIDMNEVTLRAVVRQTPIAAGMQMDVTGEGRTVDAIRRMLAAHAPMLDRMADYAATSEEMPGGARLMVRAKRPGDERTVAKIRGLGFIGLLTVGAHHAAHHLALARGDAMAHSH